MNHNQHELDAEDKPREACGIFGIHSHPEAARLTYFGLYALQHRGQESAGIAVLHGSRVTAHKGMNISAAEFMATVDDLMEAMEMNNLEQREQEEVLFAFVSMRKEVVSL